MSSLQCPSRIRRGEAVTFARTFARCERSDPQLHLRTRSSELREAPRSLKPPSTSSIVVLARSSFGRATFSCSGGSGSALFHEASADSLLRKGSSYASPRALRTAGRLAAAAFCAMALCNSMWYSAAFLLSWKALLLAASSSSAITASASSLHVLAIKAFALAYAVSQASKVPRGAAILLLVPAADRILSSVSERATTPPLFFFLGRQNGGKLSKWQVAGCFGVACLSFLLFVIATTVAATATAAAAAAAVVP